MQRLLAHAVRQACCASSSSGAAQCPPALLHHLQKNLHQHHQQWGGFSTRSTMQPPSPKAPADITPEQRQGVRACVRACAATATQRGQGGVALLLPLRAIHSQRAYAHVPAAWLPRGGVGAWLTVRVRVHACTPPHTHTHAHLRTPRPPDGQQAAVPQQAARLPGARPAHGVVGGGEHPAHGCAHAGALLRGAGPGGWGVGASRPGPWPGHPYAHTHRLPCCPAPPSGTSRPAPRLHCRRTRTSSSGSPGSCPHPRR